MIKLDAGNVLIKPSQRKQLMAWLKRALKLGERLGDFFLNITVRQVGRMVEVRANVQDRAGTFDCRARQHDWHAAFREIARTLATRLHDQKLRRLTT